MSTKKDIDNFRTNWRKRQLKYSTRPKVDFSNGQRITNEKIIDNIDKRLRHLSEVLELLYKIYKENQNLYGDGFLSFVGNEVVRGWPWKDFPLTSEKAAKLIGKDKTGFTNNEFKTDSSKFHYEHWTPIAFFRDLFDEFDDLTSENFFYALKKYYKVVRLEIEESKPLNSKYRSTRPVNIYKRLKIQVIEKEYWNENNSG